MRDPIELSEPSSLQNWRKQPITTIISRLWREIPLVMIHHARTVYDERKDTQNSLTATVTATLGLMVLFFYYKQAALGIDNPKFLGPYSISS
jgi:hypothetical protein